MKKLNSHSSSIYYFIIVFVILIIFKSFDLQTFPFWDEPTYVVDLLDNSWKMFIPGYEKEYSYTPHIFGYSFILYLGKFILGSSIVSLRIMALINFIFLSLGILKCSRIFNISKNESVSITLSVLLIPIVFTYTTFIQPDLFVFSFGIWCWNFYMKGKMKEFYIFSLIASIIFEPIQAFLVPIYIYELLKALKTKNIKNLSLAILSGCSLLIAYLFYRFITIGKFLHHNVLDEKGLTSIEWFSISQSKLVVLDDMFNSILYQSAWPLMVLITLASYGLIKKNIDKNIKTFLIFSAITSLSFIFFWFSFDEFHPRNMMSVYILILLNSILLAHQYLAKNIIVVYITLALFSFVQNMMIFSWQTPDSQYQTYKSSIQSIHDTYNYIEINKIKSISCNWPICEHIKSLSSQRKYSLNISRFYENKSILNDYIISIPFQQSKVDYELLKNSIKTHSTIYNKSYKNVNVQILKRK